MLERYSDTTPRAPHAQVGQLALHADRFAALLAQEGYAPATVRGKLQLRDELGLWLKRRQARGHGS